MKQVNILKAEIQQLRSESITADKSSFSDVNCKATLDKKIEIESSAISSEQETLKAEISNLKLAAVEQENKIMQLEKTNITQEKELTNIKAIMDEQKSIAIAKEREYENQMKKLQSNLQAVKNENQILLQRNSRLQSTMQKLQDAHNEVRQLKEDIQKLKIYYEQSAQKFMQKFLSSKQEVEKIVRKTYQDCSSIMCDHAEISRKNNTLLYENRCLKGRRYALSPANFTY